VGTSSALVVACTTGLHLVRERLPMDGEDIGSSPFVQHLKKSKTGLYRKVTANKMCICVPIESSYSVSDLKALHVESFLLRRSTENPSEFITLNFKSLLLEDGKLETKKGFAERRSVTVVSEEQCYDENLNAFTVLWVDGLLEGEATPQAADEFDALFEERKTSEECIAFLRMFPENAPALAKAEEQITAFLAHHVLVKGYLSHARSRLRDIAVTLVEKIIAQNPCMKSCKVKARNLKLLESSAACFVMSTASARLIPSLRAVLREEDALLSRAMAKVARGKFSGIGIAELSCDLSVAISHLQRLVEADSPLEMFHTTRATVRAINQAVSDATKGGVSVTADELIPLLSLSLALSEIVHPQSTLLYMSEFNLIDDTAADEWGFLETTLSAVREFLVGQLGAADGPRRMSQGFCMPARQVATPSEAAPRRGSTGALASEALAVGSQDAHWRDGVPPDLRERFGESPVDEEIQTFCPPPQPRDQDRWHRMPDVISTPDLPRLNVGREKN